MAKSYYKQRGVSTLLISTVFLLVMGVMALTVNRSTLAENKMANNEYRSIQAQQSAQAGVELFIAQLKKALITTSSIADRKDATNFEIGSNTVSGTAITQLAVAGSGNLNFKVFAVKDTTTDPAKPVIYLTSYGYADCDTNGANCQSNVKINSRIEFEQGSGEGSTPAILSVNGNIQACGNGQTGDQCSSINAYKNKHPGEKSFTDELITYGGQINGKDSSKTVEGRDTLDGKNTTVSGSDAEGPEVEKTGAKDVGTLGRDAYFEQFFGDTKDNIKNGSTTVKITPADLIKYKDGSKIPDRGAPAADGTPAKPPILWVTGDVTTADFGNAWNFTLLTPKDVIVIIDGNLSLGQTNDAMQVGFMYTTGNLKTTGGSWALRGAMAVEGNLIADTSFSLRPQQNPNDLLKLFKKPSTDITLQNGNWSDF